MARAIPKSVVPTIDLTVSTVDMYSHEGRVVDDGSIDLPDSVSGFVFITFDNGAEWVFCSITDAAVVSLIQKSSNVVNTDTDNKYCIFDNGTTVRVRNRIGTEKNVKIVAFVG